MHFHRPEHKYNCSRFHSNGTIRFVSITELSIERLGFHWSECWITKLTSRLTVDGATMSTSMAATFGLCITQSGGNHIVKIANTQTATIESTLFVNNTARALHVEADDVYITNSGFTRNGGGAVYIESNSALISNTEFNYNSAVTGGAVEAVSGTVVITWCGFTNNEASRYGGAIHVDSGSVSSPAA